MISQFKMKIKNSLVKDNNIRTRTQIKTSSKNNKENQQSGIIKANLNQRSQRKFQLRQETSYNKKSFQNSTKNIIYI